MMDHSGREIIRSCCRFLFLLGLTSLSGCFLTITHWAGGTVFSNLGDDCSFACEYQLSEGESFQGSFTATPLAGNEFVRWEDSLGDSFNMCKAPTQPLCTIEISSLHELFVGLTLDVEAQFQSITGYNVNVIHFVEPPATLRVFLKISDSLWFEGSLAPGAPFRYRQIATGETSVGLIDVTREVSYFFNLANGEVKEQIGVMPAVLLPNKIDSMSSRLSGLLVSRVSIGRTDGVQSGDFVQTDVLTWDERVRRRNKVIHSYTETNRDLSSVWLFDESRDVEVRLAVLDGMVYSRTGEEPEEAVAVIHDLYQPLSGWNATSVSYTDETEVVLGHYRAQGENMWIDEAVDSDVPTIHYELMLRDENLITLSDPERDFRILLNLENGTVTSQEGTFNLPGETFQIVEAK